MDFVPKTKQVNHSISNYLYFGKGASFRSCSTATPFLHSLGKGQGEYKVYNSNIPTLIKSRATVTSPLLHDTTYVEIFLNEFSPTDYKGIVVRKVFPFEYDNGGTKLNF